MDVRWLVTGRNMDSKQTVVGRTIMPPGVKSRHAIHRHPNAEEWEIELGKVAVKMLFAAVLIDALHAALEDRVEAFDGVRCDERSGLAVAIGVFAA